MKIWDLSKGVEPSMNFGIIYLLNWLVLEVLQQELLYVVRKRSSGSSHERVVF